VSAESRVSIGIWSELGPGARWTNEGVSRVVGFLVEGAAAGGKYTFEIVVPTGMAETVREDLSQLDALEGRDWNVWEPTARDARGSQAPIARLADFANREVPAKAWIVTFPHFSGSLALDKPKVTLFPDALPYDFPLGWHNDGSWEAHGAWPRWKRAATEVMKNSHGVITFSEHVARRHAGPICEVPREKIHVVPLAPPDLAPLLPFVEGRRQSVESRREAGAILRQYAQESGIDYLRGFPFEEIDFVAAATQDRPTKNLGLTAEAVRRIVRDRRQSIKLFLTAPVHFGVTWSRLPDIVEKDQFNRDLISLPDLPRTVHAALLHCASVVVHSSFFEGIIGSLPFYEALSLGTPSILARGPHVEELLIDEPELGHFVYDPYDPDGLAALITEVVRNREACVEAQLETYDRLCRHSWSNAASVYAEMALHGTRSATTGTI